MPQKKKQEKNIAELTNTSLLVPNVSLDKFILGSDIRGYLKNVSYVYEENPDTKKDVGYDSYCFENPDLEVWTDKNGIIRSVRSETDCYWNNINIVGLRYNKFKEIFQLEPDDQEICYLYDGTSQHVYDFDSVGLQIWVWYGVIRTVIAYQATDD